MGNIDRMTKAELPTYTIDLITDSTNHYTVSIKIDGTKKASQLNPRRNVFKKNILIIDSRDKQYPIPYAEKKKSDPSIHPSLRHLLKGGASLLIPIFPLFPRGDRDENAWRNLWRAGWKDNFAVWDVRGNVSVKWHEIITRTERAGVPRMNFYRLLHCHSYLQTEWNKRVRHVLAFIYAPLSPVLLASYIVVEERGRARCCIRDACDEGRFLSCARKMYFERC